MVLLLGHILIILVAKFISVDGLAARMANEGSSLLKSFDLEDVIRGTTLSKDLSCVFQATRDGWTHSAFHRKCDFNPPLPSLIVMKSKAGVIAGAYNPVGWQSRDDYRDSSTAFLFRVTEKGKIERSVKQGGSNAALYDFGDRAVWFAEALFVPLNPKYLGRKNVRSELGGSYSVLSCSGDYTLFGSGQSELVEMECWAPNKFILNSKRIISGDDSPAPSKPSPLTMISNFEKFLFGDK